MSILITGMEMPKEGTVFVIDSAGQVWSNEWPTRGYIRLDGVTAVPVPAHGRLIDADALDRAFTGIRWDNNGLAHWGDRKDWCLSGSEIEALISAAPTIIPADPAEGGE